MPDRSATDRDAPASPLPPAQVFEDAADLLLVHGRCKGQPRDEAGRMCARGALLAAQGLDPVRDWNTDDRPSWILEKHLDDNRTRSPQDYMSITLWNDRFSDDDEVRDTLLLVAKDLRGQAVPS